MKKIYLALICFVSLFAVSCSDILDTSPVDSFNEETVWSSKATIDAFVNQVYANVLGNYTGVAYMQSRTPDGIHSDLWNLDSFATEAGLNNYTDTGFSRFGQLRMCNMIIERAPECAALSDKQKAEFVAEGRFLRGLVFFYQTRWMGRFVPITKVLTVDDTEDFSTPLTSSVAESYKIVTDDLKAAAEGMVESSSAGRGNKYTAYAFLSRAALQAYAYTNDKSYLTMCIDASTKVIESQKYTLSTDYVNMFLEPGCYDGEIILGRYYLNENTYCSSFPEMINSFPNVKNDEIKNSGSSPLFLDKNGRSFEGWGSFFPTQDLVDQYLVIDSKDGKAKAWNETSQYLDNVEQLDGSTLAVGDFVSLPSYFNRAVPEAQDMGSNDKGQIIVEYGKTKTEGVDVSDIMYNNRDARMDAVVVRDNTTWMGEEVYTRVQGNLWAGIRDGQGDSWYTTASGYYWRKYIYSVTPNLYATNKTNYHFVLARLSEMYLNRAEAYLCNNQISSAVQDLNVTRVNHGKLPASTASSSADAWTDYRRERRCEFANENDTYWAFLRWGKIGGDANHGRPAGDVIPEMNEPAHRIQISKDGTRYFVGQIWRNGAWNRTFTVKRYLMPIPQGQIDTRSAFGIVDTQNPGW